MKIAICTNFLYPEKIGGTEIYLKNLADCLIEMGNEVFWLVPNFNQNISIDYQSDCGKWVVVKFAAIEKNNKPSLKFVAASYINTLNKYNIDIIHFHEFGGFEGMSPYLIRIAKKEGYPVVVTLHVLSYLCKTGKLKFGGIPKCNGKISFYKCTSCSIFQSKTKFRWWNYFLTLVSYCFLFLVNKFGQSLLFKRINNNTHVSSTEYLLETLKESTDKILTVSSWFKSLLLINGVDQNKLIHIDQLCTLPKISNRNSSDFKIKKRLVFIGRINKEKGIDLLLKTAQKLEYDDLLNELQIDVYGPLSSDDMKNSFYLNEIHKLKNVNYQGVVNQIDVYNILPNYKALLLPSIVIEMAPLVILEANYLKVPVIASDVLGSKEMIEKYQCGLLFESDSVHDLIRSIKSLDNEDLNFNFLSNENDDIVSIANKHNEIYTSLLIEKI